MPAGSARAIAVVLAFDRALLALPQTGDDITQQATPFDACHAGHCHSSDGFAVVSRLSLTTRARGPSNTATRPMSRLRGYVANEPRLLAEPFPAASAKLFA